MMESPNSDGSSVSCSSHEIVQRQMKDLVLFQQAAYDQMVENSVINCNSVKENTISQEELQKVLKELEEERLAHARTKARLLEVEDKLEFSLGEIEILQRQLEREKMQFEKAFDILKDKTQRETQQRTQLVSQCSALTKTTQQQQSTLSAKEKELQDLNDKLVKQKEHYEKRVIEMNLEKQQERYLNKVIENDEKKRTKRSILKPRN